MNDSAKNMNDSAKKMNVSAKYIYNSFTQLDIIISRGNHRLNFVRSCVLRLESLSYLSLFHVLCRAVYVCVMGTK